MPLCVFFREPKPYVDVSMDRLEIDVRRADTPKKARSRSGACPRPESVLGVVMDLFVDEVRQYVIVNRGRFAT